MVLSMVVHWLRVCWFEFKAKLLVATLSNCCISKGTRLINKHFLVGFGGLNIYLFLHLNKNNNSQGNNCNGAWYSNR